MEQELRVTPPPYLSGKKVEEVMDYVSTRTHKEAITADSFKGRNFNAADAALAVNFLKFFGLIDGDGKATQLMDKARIKDDRRKAEFEKIVRGGYKALFDTVDEPHKLPADKLATEFIDAYKISDRIMRSAIPVFYRMCEYAGLVAEKSSQARATVGSAKPTYAARKGTASKVEKTRVTGGMSIVPIGHLELHMPEELKNRLLTDDTIEETWRKAKAAIKALALADKPEAPNSEELGT